MANDATTTYFIQSDNIRIFPCQNRSVNTSQYGNNVLTGSNIASLINRLLSSGSSGFLISSEYDKGNPFEFNIGGYFVQVSKGIYIQDALNGNALKSADDGTIYYTDFVKFSVKDNIAYASINICKLKDSEDVEDYQYVRGIDDTEDSSNQNVQDFDKEVENGSENFDSISIIELPILTVTGSEGTYEIEDIYEDSYLEFIKLNNIDVAHDVNIDENLVVGNKVDINNNLKVDNDFFSGKIDDYTYNLKVDKDGDISAENGDVTIKRSDTTSNEGNVEVKIKGSGGVTTITNGSIENENTITSYGDITAHGCDINVEKQINNESDEDEKVVGGNLHVDLAADFENAQVKIDVDNDGIGRVTINNVETNQAIITGGDIKASTSIEIGRYEEKGEGEGVTVNYNFSVDDEGNINTKGDVNVKGSGNLEGGLVKTGTATYNDRTSGQITVSNDTNSTQKTTITDDSIAVDNISTGDVSTDDIVASNSLKAGYQGSDKYTLNVDKDEDSDGNVAYNIVINGAKFIVDAEGNVTISGTLSVDDGSFTVDDDHNITALGTITTTGGLSSSLTITLNGNSATYNGSNNANKSVSFYAPTNGRDSASTREQYLKSSGTDSAPAWEPVADPNNASTLIAKYF